MTSDRLRNKTAIERQIQVAGRHIDQFVFELHGLTTAEYRIVEGVT